MSGLNNYSTNNKVLHTLVLFLNNITTHIPKGNLPYIIKKFNNCKLNLHVQSFYIININFSISNSPFCVIPWKKLFHEQDNG